MRLLCACLLVAPCIFAEGPEFEVASIKPSVPAPSVYGGGPGTADPTHITVGATPLTSLMLMAFDIKPYQFANLSSVVDGVFDFALVLPTGATTEDVKTMWRNLLISRFGLKYHVEQREFPVDELVVGPKGHKLIENHDPPSVPIAGALVIETDKDGRLTIPRTGLVSSRRGGSLVWRMVGRGQAISDLVERLSLQMAHPVIDKTGLTGKYDFAVQFENPRTLPPRPAKAGAGTDPESAPELPGALEQQLGLRLVKGKGMLDVVVVEKIERAPTEN